MTELTVERVERDGMVAVLVSPGYGAGWSTWATHTEAAIFAPDVVAWVEAGKPGDKPGDFEQFQKYGYLGGLRDVGIEWVPKGSRFIIEEYDGSETLHIIDPDYGYVA